MPTPIPQPRAIMDLWKRIRLRLPLPNLLDERHRAATFKLESKRTGKSASAVAISPKGHFISCFHIFANDPDWQGAAADETSTKKWIATNFHAVLPGEGDHEQPFVNADFDVLAFGYDRASFVDFALCKLKLRRPPTFLPVSLLKRQDGNFRIWGFSQALANLTPADAKLIGTFKPNPADNVELLHLSSDQANDHGFSGAGLCSASAGGVAGIQIRGVAPDIYLHLSNVILAYSVRSIAALHDVGEFGRWRTFLWSVEAGLYRTIDRFRRRSSYVFATILTTLVLFGIYEAYRLYITDQKLHAASADIEHNAREAAFFSDQGGYEMFKKFRQDTGKSHCDAIRPFLEQHHIIQPVRKLSMRMHDTATCALTGHCFAAKICRELYRPMRLHYNFYNCAFRKKDDQAFEAQTFKNVEKLLTQGCDTERRTECLEQEQIVNDQARACGKGPSSRECLELPITAACSRLRTWCSGVSTRTLDRHCRT